MSPGPRRQGAFWRNTASVQDTHHAPELESKAEANAGEAEANSGKNVGRDFLLSAPSKESREGFACLSSSFSIPMLGHEDGTQSAAMSKKRGPGERANGEEPSGTHCRIEQGAASTSSKAGKAAGLELHPAAAKKPPKA